MSKAILMICYYYPPLTDVGCKRSLAFAKYLKTYGWDPYVISVKNPDKGYCSLGDDSSPPQIPVQYTYSILNVYEFLGKLNRVIVEIAKRFGREIERNYFYDIFCVPDIFLGWIPLTTLSAFRSVRQHAIDVIYVSCKPISSAFIGVLLKFVTGRPLIIDFRDPFATKIRRSSTRPRSRIKVDRFIERYIVRQADIFLVVSHEMKQKYIEEYADLADRTFVIHNGVDPDAIPVGRPITKYPKFTIVYAGLYFYQPHEWGAEFFFEALAVLKEKEKIHKDDFQFLFYGDGSDKIDKIAGRYGVKDLVTARSRIPYQDIIDVISSAHMQLLRNRELVIPSKLYDGVSLNVPFLATIPPGEAEHIIRRYSPSSYVITRESAEEVAEAIQDAIEKYRKNRIEDNHVEEFLERFSRDSLTRTLMKIIESRIH